MVKNKEIKKETALDDIYRGFRDELVETYVETGKVEIPALAVIPDGRDGHDPFVVFPLYDVYVSADANGKINVNSEQLRACHSVATEIGSDVAMFISAVPSRTESEFGVKDALLLAAKQADGLTIINLWLKDLEGKDGVLTESVGHGYESWTKGPKEDSLETAVGLALIDALWTEYILVSRVETLFDDPN